MGNNRGRRFTASGIENCNGFVLRAFAGTLRLRLGVCTPAFIVELVAVTNADVDADCAPAFALLCFL